MSNRLMLFDTLRARKIPFEPLEPGKVRMFVCGPTVQGPMHMGHARTYIFYDVLARYFAYLGFQVEYVMNITDIDERITHASARTGETPFALARRVEASFRRDFRDLGISGVSSFPRVSSYVKVMLRQIAKLIADGYAYPVEGWVYFDTSKFPDFGKLSHQSKRQLSLRPLELSLRKKNLLDFSLWRPELLVKGQWDSPWGLGSPGWHIQDTAVTQSILGPTYDLHGGAYELIYPHHEAEIAQGESLSGVTPLVRHWVHTRLVNMSGRKMSKSAGNVYSVREALSKYSASEIRYFLLSTHYRQDMNLDGMDSKVDEFRSIRAIVARLAAKPSRLRPGRHGGSVASFLSTMNDDVDTPSALAQIGALVEEVEESDGPRARSSLLEVLNISSRILGIDFLGHT
jgi:cysteinyl-tRNA synthetase